MPNIIKYILIILLLIILILLYGFRAAIEIAGIVSEPPSITASVNPMPNDMGWNNTDVTVSFNCSDLLSGVADCPAPVTLTTEADDYAVSGTAIDNAGNSSTISIAVKIDKTPPIVTRTWPPAIVFFTDLDRIIIEGSIADNLSGTTRADISDDFQAGAMLSFPTFSIERNLRTELPPGLPEADTEFTIEAFDIAGNSKRWGFLVGHTPNSGVIPTDVTKTETVNGIVTSTNRALVRFQPSINRDGIEQIIRAQGGRVAGVLSYTNTALVDFETENVADLKTKLAALEAGAEVVVALPVIFFQPQFDNDLLSATNRRAYTSVKLSEAGNYIINNSIQQNQVGIAVIDSGMDAAYGQNNEFSSINFYDLCTWSGQNGQPGTPSDDTGHGTKMTGIIAGANNNSGNNGIDRGIPGTQVDVSIFRTQCDAAEDGLDGALIIKALDMITNGTVSEIKVVNMSFGLGSADAASKAWLASFYEPYLRSSAGDDILWIASAGNNDTETTCNGFLMYPAGLACTLPNVVSVGGYNPASNVRAPLSNYGNAVTLNAPGTGVYTAVNPGSYGLIGNTSSATAMVSGAAALLLSVNPMPPSQAKIVLKSTTQALADANLAQGGLDIAALVATAPFPPLARKTFTGDSNGGLVVTGHSPYVSYPGLAGFRLDFDSDDHKIQTILAGFFQEEPGIALITEYSDNNADDNYSWTIDRLGLPAGTILHEALGSADYGFNKVLMPPGFVGVPVLMGFMLQTVSGGDHNMDKIRVRLFRDQFGQLELGMTFQDKSGDFDINYRYRVAYALVPPDRVVGSGVLTGSDGGGSDSATLTANQPVLQGFELDFDSNDHHLDQIGVRLEAGTARIWYNDKNNDDNFHWKIWWTDVQ